MADRFELSPEDIKVFLDEAEELLQVMEENFLRLEKSREPELLQDIFRAAHTLKGSSATLGHRNMAEVTHSMENIFDKLRKGKTQVTSGVVDTLFACLDVLRAYKDEIATGEDARVDRDGILNRLRVLDEGTNTGASVAPMVAAGAVLTWDERQEASEGLEKGERLWMVHIAIEPNSPMPAVRAFQSLMALGELGTVVRSWPSQEDVEQDRVGLDLRALLVGGSRPEEIRKGLAEIQETSVIGVVEQNAASLAAPQEADSPDEAAEGAKAEAISSEGNRDRLRGNRTVRVDVEILDSLMNLVGELVIDRTRLTQIVGTLEGRYQVGDVAQDLGRASAHIGRVTGELQERIMRARMLPVENLFKKFPRMVRDLSIKAGKEMDFILRGEETELDRSVIEEIGDPLMHLLRNAVDHAIESPEERVRAGKPARGTVILEASQQENQIVLVVRDDGRGIDPEKIRNHAIRKGVLTAESAKRLSEAEVIDLIFSAGFSTAEKISDISGRGVGMDVVRKNIEKLNGTIEIDTRVGQGTEFRIKLPLTLAIIRALLVEIDREVFAIPLSSVTETHRIPLAEIKTVNRREVIMLRGKVLPLLRLVDLLGFNVEEKEAQEYVLVVIINLGGKEVGIAVHSLVGEQEVVIKSLGTFLGEIPGLSGATILGDGNVAIILDVPSLVKALVPNAVKTA